MLDVDEAHLGCCSPRRASTGGSEWTAGRGLDRARARVGRLRLCQVAEDSFYVSSDAQGRGIGRALLAAVVASAKRGGIWTVQTGSFPENQASVRLHQACGFRVVGIRERLGRLHGRWRDVLLLERRNPVIS